MVDHHPPVAPGGGGSAPGSRWGRHLLTPRPVGTSGGSYAPGVGVLYLGREAFSLRFGQVDGEDRDPASGETEPIQARLEAVESRATRAEAALVDAQAEARSPAPAEATGAEIRFSGAPQIRAPDISSSART